MKNCDCDLWTEYVGNYFDEAKNNPLGEPDAPFYFGVAIDYCPWCGKKLIFHTEPVGRG